VTFAATVEDSDEVESEGEEPFSLFDMKELRKGIAEFEADMSPFVKLNILFVQIGTKEFSRALDIGYDKVDNAYPNSATRDFFMKQLDFNVAGGKSAYLLREVTQMCQFLDISKLAMPLDRDDWKTVSRILFTLVARGNFAHR
jgi:hypothetical protein